MSLRRRYSPRITNRDFKLPSTIIRNVMLGYKEKTNKKQFLLYFHVSSVKKS